jgi:hypothetical protein
MVALRQPESHAFNRQRCLAQPFYLFCIIFILFIICLFVYLFIFVLCVLSCSTFLFILFYLLFFVILCAVLLNLSVYLPWRRGAVNIASASGTRRPGFESHQGIRFLGKHSSAVVYKNDLTSIACVLKRRSM